MTIEERLNEELKTAMKAGERDKVDALRMAKSKIVERQKAPGFQGPMTDRMAQDVISAYAKSLKKAIDEIEAGGQKTNPILDKYRWEIAFLSGYLPKTLDEAATRELVREAIAGTGASAPNHVGKVMGFVMKGHKDDVDAALVKRLAEELLKPAG